MSLNVILVCRKIGNVGYGFRSTIRRTCEVGRICRCAGRPARHVKGPDAVAISGRQLSATRFFKSFGNSGSRSSLGLAQKNDAADAEPICEAVARPNMRFVATKTPEQQSCLTGARGRGNLRPHFP